MHADPVLTFEKSTTAQWLWKISALVKQVLFVLDKTSAYSTPDPLNFYEILKMILR